MTNRSPIANAAWAGVNLALVVAVSFILTVATVRQSEKPPDLPAPEWRDFAAHAFVPGLPSSVNWPVSIVTESASLPLSLPPGTAITGLRMCYEAHPDTEEAVAALVLVVRDHDDFATNPPGIAAMIGDEHTEVFAGCIDGADGLPILVEAGKTYTLSAISNTNVAFFSVGIQLLEFEQ